MITYTPPFRHGIELIDSTVKIDDTVVGTFSKACFDAPYTFKAKRGVELDVLELAQIIGAIIKIDEEVIL